MTNTYDFVLYDLFNLEPVKRSAEVMRECLGVRVMAQASAF